VIFQVVKINPESEWRYGVFNPCETSYFRVSTFGKKKFC
jgi:hypothetical protein